MKKLVLSLLTVALSAAVFVAGCRPDPALEDAAPAPDVPVEPIPPIDFRKPQGWRFPSYNFAANPLSQRGFELGRKLFYEVRLSRNNTISCGNCHSQEHAFSHPGGAVSAGIDGRTGTRNAPGLFNLAWKSNYFWDGSIHDLDSLPISPIENHVEMDMKLSDAVAKINADGTYRALFKQAFDVDSVTSIYMFRALSQFMAAMVSSNSRYDKYVRGEAGAEMSSQELLGLDVFRNTCSFCHKEPLFTDESFRNNGLALDPRYNDSGRFRITHLPGDRFLFQVASLRNVALTAPYMHDGRFNTLEEVLDHYSNGIHPSPTLDGMLVGGLQLSESRKAAIIAFLKTLTDDEFVKDRRFSK